MTGLLLTLALAVGQQCPGGSCVQPATSTRSTFSDEFREGWKRYCVRVDIKNGNSGHGGSGTIIDVVEGKAIVITARHVAENPGVASVRHRGIEYPARVLAIASEGDLAALEFDNPPADVDKLRIADKPGQRVMMFGYGPGYPGTLHVHSGQYLNDRFTPQMYNPAREPDHEYRMKCESGDSGGGVFDEQGDLCGVLYAGDGGYSSVVSIRKLRQFLQAPVSEERVFTLSPFFIKCKRKITRQPAPVVQNPSPSQPTQVLPGVAGPPGPQGPAGPAGPTGPPGATGTSPDLSAIEARLAALETTVGRAVSASEKALANTLRPITVNTITTKGKIKGAPAQLGSEINLDVRDPSTEARLSALEAKLANVK